jgi:hypothetical protein
MALTATSDLQQPFSDGYYSGEKYIKAIEAGFENAISVIDALKPYSKNGEEQ